MTDQEPDEVELDHDDELADDEILSEEEEALFALFAEALDPNDPKTIDEAVAEWREVLG